MTQDFQLVKKLNEFKNKVYIDRLIEAQKSTICFFREDKKDVRKVAGSGIFIQIEGQGYLITAAHVLAEFYKNTFVILPDEELFLGGNLTSTELPKTQKRDDDKIDISVFKINNECRDKLLKKYTPLRINEIQLKHVLRDSPSYFLVGYPITKTKKVWNKDEIKSQAFTFQSEPDLNFDYKRFGFNEKTTIALKFDGEVTSAKIPNPHLSPDLKGMSGSGLWYFNSDNKKRLIGIVIERINTAKYKAVLSTRFDLVKYIIEKSAL